MIYSNLVSGLGNQLFQYVMGRQLSLIHNVDLKLDVRHFDSQKLRAFKLNHYRINAEIAREQEIEGFLKPYLNSGLYYKVFRKIAHQFPKHQRRYFKENEWWVYEQDILKTPSSVYIEGYWQHYKYFENLHPQILDELTINEGYNSDVAKLVSEIENNPNSISLHIRRGDYITDSQANSLMGIMPLSYYYSAIAYLKHRLPAPHIYIFSDDLDWVFDNLKTDIPVTLVDIEDGKKDYLELDIMSKCRHQIIANSSFSWWGAFLNRNPDKIVIAPQKWVVPPNINSKINIQMPTWIKL